MHAPVLDYLLSALRAHRASGRVHVDVAHGLDNYSEVCSKDQVAYPWSSRVRHGAAVGRAP